MVTYPSSLCSFVLPVAKVHNHNDIQMFASRRRLVEHWQRFLLSKYSNRKEEMIVRLNMSTG